MNLITKIKKVFPNFKNNELEYWSNISSITKDKVNSFHKKLNEINKINNPTKKLFVLDEFVSIILSDLIDKSGCNIIIYNVPNGKSEKVYEETIFETFKDYGPIFAIHLYRNTAYIWFFRNLDAKYLHSNINHMECKGNILNTYYNPHKLITECFDWITNTKYESFKINEIQLNMENVDNYWSMILNSNER